MTRQVPESSPITVTARSTATGGIVFDTDIKVDGGALYADRERSDKIKKADQKSNGAGDLTFYGEPGKTYTFDMGDGIHDVEAVQVVPLTLRPSGHVGVDAHTVPEDVSEQVSDSSLVGAPAYRLDDDEGGALAAVRAADAVDIPPGPPAEGTPDGTTATDPSDAPGPGNATPGPGEKDPGPQIADSTLSKKDLKANQPDEPDDVELIGTDTAANAEEALTGEVSVRGEVKTVDADDLVADAGAVIPGEPAQVIDDPEK